MRLSASDSELTGLDETQVVVRPANQPPRLDIGRDLIVGRTGVAITLPGVTTDEDGGPTEATIRWIQTTGPAAVTLTPSAGVTQASFPDNGSYRLRAVASDGNQASTAILNVLVDDTGVNRAPTLSAGPDRLIVLPNQQANLTGWVTDDGLPTANVAQFWTKVSGPGIVNFSNAAAAVTSAHFSSAGIYVLRLTANDGVLSASDDVVVAVATGTSNLAPLADAGPDRTISLPQQSVGLAGLAADDGQPAGGSLTSQWSKVSGPGTVVFADATQPATTATLGAPGTYVLRLSVSDGALSTADDLVVRLTEPNQAPVVSAGPDQATTLPHPGRVVLAGSATDDGLPPGSVLGYQWVQIDGPAAATIETPSATSTGVRFTSHRQLPVPPGGQRLAAERIRRGHRGGRARQPAASGDRRLRSKHRPAVPHGGPVRLRH